ncbi:hypothetical protein BST61_g7615 [Cercospora zeina]
MALEGSFVRKSEWRPRGSESTIKLEPELDSLFWNKASDILASSTVGQYNYLSSTRLNQANNEASIAMASTYDKDIEDEVLARWTLIKRLEFEVKQHRAAITALQKAKRNAPCSLFEKLPPEILDKIWGYCVAPGRVFLTNTKSRFDIRFGDFGCYEKPHWPLLAVNRAIRLQAAKVLFEQNKIVFPYNRTAGDFQNFISNFSDYPSDDDDEISLHSLARKHIRSASIAFDLRASHSPYVLRGMANMHFRNGSAAGNWHSLPDQARMQRAHTIAMKHTYSSNGMLLDVLVGYCPSLKALEIDLTNCYCSIGCCRAVYTAMEFALEVGRKWPEHVRVLGTKDHTERGTVQSAVGAGRRFGEPYTSTIVFEKFKPWNEVQDGNGVVAEYWKDVAEDGVDVELYREVVKIE